MACVRVENLRAAQISTAVVPHIHSTNPFQNSSQSKKISDTMGGTRGKAWTEAEDIQLCHSFLKASKDAVSGDQKTGEVLWRDVFEDFKKHMPDHNDRTIDRLSKR